METQVVDPAVFEQAKRIHVSESAQQIAERAKDASAFERALLIKLEAQRDFAAAYRAKFTQGTRTDLTSDGTGRSSAEQYCVSFGFAYRTVARWCDRLLDPAKFIAEKNAIVDKCWSLAELWQSANFMSESVEWYTPARYLAAVHEVLGGVDLDPASNEVANQVVCAARYFTQKDDGLQQDWAGRVFVNPPYGKHKEYGSLASAFCNKAISEYESGSVEACIILVNSSHSQNWQAPLYSYPVCFVDHRIQFVSGDGEENKSPTFQNIFIYLGKEQGKFAEAFRSIGYVMVPYA